MLDLVWLVPALPLFGAVINLFVGRRLGRRAGWLASAAVAGSFAVALLVFTDLLSRPGEERLFTQGLHSWIPVGSFRAAVDLRVDPLSTTMALVVTGVSALIHVYSIGYMAGDARFARYFAFLNLFVFFMLTLVLAQNFLLLYVGWEGVGLCSYLLIGHYLERPAAATAAKKAFIVTRIGDTAFLVGIALIFATFGSLDFSVVLGPGQAAGIASSTATVIALLIFAGAVGKSAQMPLHVWLPDAMEGPTPVSALIHAATMVTAGVYLVVRSHVLFELSGLALTVVLGVGLATALYAATAALGQDDMKRVLAYSTISQLGFMFFAAGMQAYAAAIFLLVTHAFFKAVMFLGAGSVMHALDGETDLKRMGGLWRAMPVTAATYLVGALAISGIPPLSGFFSKDQILAVANQTGRTALWAVAVAAAFFSALYIARKFSLAFLGPGRYEGHPHESPPVMTVPMGLLAVGAAAGGLLGTSALGGIIPEFLTPVVGEAVEGGRGLSEAALAAISVGVAAAAILVGWFVYASGQVDWVALRARLGGLRRALERAWYVDDAYAALLVAPGKAGSAFLAYVLDQRVIDGAVNRIAGFFGVLASVGRLVQSGLVRNYALAFLLGAVGILIYVAVRF